jgi:UV DNA damage repair endonuclease
VGCSEPRFVITNIQNRTPRFIYDTLYCARGRAEGFIKDHKTHLQSDRTSCHRFEANQFRLFLHSAAYVLLHALREVVLRGTGLSNVYFNTLQLRLLKVGARVEELATRIRFHFPTSYPLQNLMRTVVHNLDTA